MRRDAATKLLARNRVGALLRIFSPTPEALESQIASAIRATDKLLALKVGDRPVFSRIDFLVSNDNRFPDSDFGGTAARLRTEIRGRYAGAPVSVLDVKSGDIYCMLLDYGVVNQLEDRVSYSLIVSHGVSEYLTVENVEALLAAVYCRARVAGLAINEIRSLVLQGRIANTCALWHNKSLMTVGGFDLRAAKPEHARVADVPKVTVSGVLDDAKHEYLLAGCEEIIPLLRFVKFFGPSAAVVSPRGTHAWNTKESCTDQSMYARHVAKLATKEIRQAHMAALENLSLDVLKRSIVDLDASICNPEEVTEI